MTSHCSKMSSFLMTYSSNFIVSGNLPVWPAAGKNRKGVEKLISAVVRKAEVFDDVREIVWVNVVL